MRLPRSLLDAALLSIAVFLLTALFAQPGTVQITADRPIKGETPDDDRDHRGPGTGHEAGGRGQETLHGIGPSCAARLIGDVGDITRFASRGHFAAWNGTAPLDASSGAQRRHRLSRAGNRRINRVLHIMAVVQLRHDTDHA